MTQYLLERRSIASINRQFYLFSPELLYNRVVGTDFHHTTTACVLVACSTQHLTFLPFHNGANRINPGRGMVPSEKKCNLMPSMGGKWHCSNKRNDSLLIFLAFTGPKELSTCLEKESGPQGSIEKGEDSGYFVLLVKIVFFFDCEFFIILYN